MKIKIILIILILILTLTITLLIIQSQQNITGQAIRNNYTFTKAICNNSNYCQDYEIICESNTLKEIRPITGAAVQYPETWKDPRTKEQIEKLCN